MNDDKQERGEPALPVETAPSPDPALTLKNARLAGSACCLNCGTELQGPFCHYCGQPDRNFLRFFPALMREFMEEFLDLDSRFVRTMKPLLFKPGKLTRDYLEGRRFRYTPPLRLYLFSSIGFFLLAAFLSSNAINVGMSVDPRTGEPHLNISTDSNGNPLSDEQRRDIREALEQARVNVPADVIRGLNEELAQTTPQAPPGEPFSAEKIMVDGKPWDKETNPVRLDYVPGFVNTWINNEIEKSPAKARRINDNPNIIIDQLFDILPGAMFVLLPVVALLFKFWYAFARRFYMEHLIYALHNHAFIFVSAIFILLCNLTLGWAQARGLDWLVQGAHWAMIATGVWIPLYLLISLRRVYAQGWFLTTAKFSVIGLSYITLLAFTSSVIAIMSFVLL